MRCTGVPQTGHGWSQRPCTAISPWNAVTFSGNAPAASNLANRCGIECLSDAQQHGFSMRLTYNDRDPFVDTGPVGSFPAGDTPLGLHTFPVENGAPVKVDYKV